MQKETQTPLWKRLLFSDAMLGRSYARRLAWISVMTALCILSNLLEFKFADIQFSLTLSASVLAGIIVGPVLGCAAAMLGDFLGFVVNSWGFLYMPWVGLSCAAMALIAGLVMKLPFHFRGSGYVKLAIICVLVLFFCSIGINTTGFYFYYTRVGFSAKALSLVEEYFGGNSYLAYALVRLLFMGQIWNSLFNYAILFLAVPLLNAAKPLGIRIC